MQTPLPGETPWDVVVEETDAIPEEVWATVQGFVDALNAHDIPTVVSFLAEDAFYDVMIGQLDVAGYEAALVAYQAAQTDWSLSIVEEPITFAEGNTVYSLDILHGFFTGELAGIPGNGNEIFLPVSSILKVRDGKITHLWSNYDTLSFVTQLNAPPAEDKSE
jgi:steroid delta-isomerase-like uncharacterized protein